MAKRVKLFLLPLLLARETLGWGKFTIAPPAMCLACGWRRKVDHAVLPRCPVRPARMMGGVYPTSRPASHEPSGNDIGGEHNQNQEENYALEDAQSGGSSVQPSPLAATNWESNSESKGDDKGASGVLVSTIQWYKDWISPLMGPNCRFYPTCSSYAIASIREFGPSKGLLLTSWRILRCNPFGGNGVDRPQWPPPGWSAGSSWDADAPP